MNSHLQCHIYKVPQCSLPAITCYTDLCKLGILGIESKEVLLLWAEPSVS